MIALCHKMEYALFLFTDLAKCIGTAEVTIKWYFKLMNLNFSSLDI
jgi:hypothetical protein